MPLKPFRLAMLCVLASITFYAHSQTLVVQKGIFMPPDSVVRTALINSLYSFLGQKEKPNKENTFVLPADLLETSDLLDEMKGIEQNYQTGDKSYYKCYVTNVVKLDEENYVVQLSYIGVKDNVPTLDASFRLLAKKQGDKFYFNSPLKQNTATWKIKKYKDLTCYFKDTANVAKAKAYQSKIAFYDEKLKIPTLPLDFYYCDNFTEALQVLGVDYKMDYNGSRSNNLNSHSKDKNILVNGLINNGFDPHDLWHERLRIVMSPDIINRPVDEGCAYLYGGSWGYSWPEVLTKFKKYIADNPNADWLQLYMDVTNIEGGQKPIKAAYVLNALIVQKIELEKGFTPVLQLLGCGKKAKGDENYFAALEKLTGINKANFNAEMWKLIKAEK